MAKHYRKTMLRQLNNITFVVFITLGFPARRLTLQVYGWLECDLKELS